MYGIAMKVRDGLGTWLGGLGRVFGSKGREASKELLKGSGAGGALTAAEEALAGAMGWDEEGPGPGAVVAKKAKEALK